MENLGTFFLLAFGSGLTALLTPCVFPMIPLTVSFFGGHPPGSEQKGDGQLHFLNSYGQDSKGKTKSGIKRACLYGIFIILIYVAAGTLVAYFNGPGFANWLSTHWLPNVIFFLIFLVFALSFLGMFEITLPSSLINRMDGLGNKKQGWLGTFFMAFTLVLVSFSCTGPIVGSVLVLSAGGEVLKPIVGMFAFSLALALPFTLLAAFPKGLAALPKSGGWLQEVRVVLGFLELALALKFLSIADQVYHWGILDREVYLALWIVIFGTLGLYLLGMVKIANGHESFSTPEQVSYRGRTTVPKLILSIITFGFVTYMLPGMFGAPLQRLSGYLPPMTTQEFIMNSPVSIPPQKNVSQSSFDNKRKHDREGDTLQNCPSPKYSELFKLPHGLTGYFDLEEAKTCARIQNKPIFIDFTGHGCVNCREMEARVWSHKEVLRLLREEYIVVALYVDDKTELPEEEWYKSEYDGRTKKSIGKQNGDYQIRKFVNNAQPFYVLMDSEEKLLTDPMAYDLNIRNFIEFLEKGIEEYKSHT